MEAKPRWVEARGLRAGPFSLRPFANIYRPPKGTSTLYLRTGFWGCRRTQQSPERPTTLGGRACPRAVFGLCCAAAAFAAK